MRRDLRQPPKGLRICLQKLGVAVAQTVGVEPAAHGAARKMHDECRLGHMRRIHILPPDCAFMWDSDKMMSSNLCTWET